MAFLALDECVAKCCARGGTLYTAQRTIHVPGLGRQATDEDIFLFVQRSHCVLVTLNGCDFYELVLERGPIPVIVLPSVRPRRQHEFLKAVVPIAESVFARDASRFVEVSANGRVHSYRVAHGTDWQRRATPSPRPPDAATH